MPTGESCHTCHVCGATDVSHPDRDFFVTEDGNEICNVCLEAQESEEGPKESTP